MAPPPGLRDSTRPGVSQPVGNRAGRVISQRTLLSLSVQHGGLQHHSPIRRCWTWRAGLPICSHPFSLSIDKKVRDNVLEKKLLCSAQSAEMSSRRTPPLSGNANQSSASQHTRWLFSSSFLQENKEIDSEKKNRRGGDRPVSSAPLLIGPPAAIGSHRGLFF